MNCNEEPIDDKIVIYQTPDGNTAIDVKLENETVWLTANQMSELFDRDAKTIRKHINNVFSEEELSKISNTQKMRVALSDKPVPFAVNQNVAEQHYDELIHLIHVLEQTVDNQEKLSIDETSVQEGIKQSYYYEGYYNY